MKKHEFEIDWENVEAILISETHWDRAWYRTFEQFRLRLVQLVDNLIDILEKDPSFTYFTFDGQTVVLEDYLEVKPHEHDRLKNLISEGRILVGPWYVLPDVFLVSGESLIRNLMIGRRLANEFGKSMNVGYIPDPFGHISQLPQILHQCGCNSVIFARGMGDESEDLGAEFIWESSDGTELLAHWLPLSYGNASTLPLEIDDAVSMLEDVIKQLRPWTRTGLLLLMNGSDHVEPQPHIPEVIRAYNRSHDRKIVMGTLPLFIEQVSKQSNNLKHFRGEFRKSKHQNLLSGVYSTRVYLKQANEQSQKLLERWVEPWCVVASILSGTYPQSEIGQAWKYLLRNHPHDDICGCSIDEVHDDMMIRYRWVNEIGQDLLARTLGIIEKEYQTESPGLLVLNPSPFVRSGVAIFELALSDLRFGRLSDVKLFDPFLKAETPLEAAKNELHIAFVRLRGGFDLPPTAERQVKVGKEILTEFEFDFTALVMMFPNIGTPLRHLSTAYRIRVNSKNEVVEVWARKFDAQALMSGMPVITNEQGKTAPTQILSTMFHQNPETRLVADREEYIKLAIFSDEIPGIGVRRYNLSLATDPAEFDMSGPVIVRNNSLENDLLKVEVENDGLVTITDKRTGEEYGGLLEFEDSEDVGDTYDYCPASQHLSKRSRGLEVIIRPEHTGPLVGSIVITGELELPISATPDLTGRSEETVICDFLIELTLYAGSPTVHVEVKFENLAEDHRLRVLFPTGTNGQTCIADSAFDVIERPIHPAPAKDWIQPPAPTYPLRSFVSMSSEKRGLTISTKGLLEFEVLDEKGGTIALTLLRAVGWLSRVIMLTRKEAAGPILETPGAQCLGTNSYEFSITPHTKNWRASDAHIEAEEFLLPFKVRFLPSIEEANNHYKHGYLHINPDTVKLSAFKGAENGEGLILRLWNSSNVTEKCLVRFGFQVSKVVEMHADETFDEEIEITPKGNGLFEIVIPSRKIVTVLVST